MISAANYHIYVNAHTGAISGPFPSHYIAYVTAIREGNRELNGAIVLQSLQEARKIFSGGWTGIFKDSCLLDSSKRQPMYVCSWGEYNAEFDRMLAELEPSVNSTIQTEGI